MRPVKSGLGRAIKYLGEFSERIRLVSLVCALYNGVPLQLPALQKSLPGQQREPYARAA